MNEFVKILNKPKEAFIEKHTKIATIILLLTIFSVTVFDPILGLLKENRQIDILNMLKLTVLGFVLYLVYCIGMYSICKIFSSKQILKIYISRWPLTMMPTLICGFVVSFAENYYYIFWNNSIWGMVFNIIFATIFIWKTILYIIFLKYVVELKGLKLILGLIVNGIFILILAAIMCYIGLKVPII